VTLFFERPDEWRAWLEENHDRAAEVLVGFRKKSTGKPSITWPESVDEALCFGWIDGVRRSLDDDSYVIRFTPRKSRSTWSVVNVRRAQELIRLGRMTPAGLRAFEARVEDRTAIYSYEQRRAELEGPYADRMRRNPRAWEFFHTQPPGYRRAAAWWVTSAKKEETRLRRLATLIEDSAHGRTIVQLTRKPK